MDCLHIPQGKKINFTDNNWTFHLLFISVSVPSVPGVLLTFDFEFIIRIAIHKIVNISI